MRVKLALVGALNQIIYFIPRLFSAAVILAVGLLIAWGVAVLVRRLAHAVGVDRFFARHQVAPRALTTRSISNASGRIVYWVIALVTLVAALDALEIPSVTAGLVRVVAYLPNLFAAGLVALAGYLCGQAVYRLAVRRGGATAQTWGRIARGSIFTVAGFMAIQELNVAVGIISLLFAFAIGAMAVAFAISFGLGNRELAARVTREWWDHNHPGRMREDTSSASGIDVPPIPTPEPIIHRADSDEEYPHEPRH